MVRFIIYKYLMKVTKDAQIYIPLWLDLLLTKKTTKKRKKKIYIPLWLDLLSLP